MPFETQAAILERESIKLLIAALSCGVAAFLVSIWNIRSGKVGANLGWIIREEQPIYFFFWMTCVILGSAALIAISSIRLVEKLWTVQLLSQNTPLDRWAWLLGATFTIVHLGYSLVKLPIGRLFRRGR